MVRGRLALVILACGCGRFHFDPLDGPADARGDAAIAPDALGPVDIAYVKASDTTAFAELGISVAISGDAQTFATGAIDVNGAASHTGAAYVYVRSGATWAQQAKLTAQGAQALDELGNAIALSGDGSTLVVGASQEDGGTTGVNSVDDNAAIDAGAAYVFERTGTTWAETAYVKASNTNAGDQFGTSVAISGDGSTIAIGAISEASASTGIDGDQGDNSQPAAGAVYVFVRNGATWVQQAYLKASNTDSNDAFGFAVALSNDGNTLAVGAEGEASAAIGIGGSQADNSAPQAGAIYVFARADTAWSQQAYVKGSETTSGNFLGESVALSPDGNTLAGGAPGDDSAAPNAGAVFVFARTGTTWSEQATVVASNEDADDQFGASVALGDGLLMSGSPQEDGGGSGFTGDAADNSSVDSGAAYVFERTGGTWAQAAYVKATNPGAGDDYGTSVTLADLGFAAGANREDSSTTGIDSTPDDNATDSGAAYVMFR